MDCNSIIYDTFHSLSKEPGVPKNTETFENILIQRVIQKIEFYVDKIKPSNVLYIAFDGVAPFAKMDQQRTRRYKSWFMSTISLQPTSTNWNTCAITPGTQFMNQLSKKISFVFENNEKKYGTKCILFSGSNEPGEGEHKMFQHLRDHYQPYDNVCVYGLDSDLIMLSLFHCRLCKNIFIFREAPEFAKSKIDVKSDHNELIFMDIGYLSDSILREMDCQFSHSHRMYDYIFLCFFLGNDFLPHFPSLNIRTCGTQILMDTYRKYIGNYPERFFISQETGKIQWKWINLLISELAKMERDHFLEEMALRDKMDRYQYPTNTPEEKETALLNTPIIYRAEEKYICPQERGWEERYYKVLFEKTRTEENVKQICMNYLEGLEWVFKYYTEGCPHWKWKYHYHYPPLLSDLIKYVPHFEMDFIDDVSAVNHRPFDPEVQLAYVLPYVYYDLLPKKMKGIVEKELLIELKQPLTFQWSFCRYFWETHLKLPEISLESLESWKTR
jgi:5'-3' exonuclease